MTRRRAVRRRRRPLRSVGLNPTLLAICWAARVQRAMAVILDGYTPDTDPAPTLRRLEGMNAAYQRSHRLIVAGARPYK